MFICPHCNMLVEDPDYVRPGFGSYWRRKYPVCVHGHPLRTRLLGNLTERAFPFGFSRSFFLALLGLACALLADARDNRRLLGGHMAVGIMSAFLAGCGIFAMGYAWSWAGRPGPVRKLVSRAAGVGAGYLLVVLFGIWALLLDFSLRSLPLPLRW